MTDAPVDPAIAYFEAVSECAEQAAGAVGGFIEQSYLVGGLPVRARFAGPALIPLLAPALAHLRVASVPTPALTIMAWDSATTGVLLPDFGVVQRRRESVAKSAIYGLLIDDGLNLSMLDLAHNQAIFWAPDASEVRFNHRSEPFHMIFHWRLRADGLRIVHAGAVGNERGGVLLAGKSGSGKSTTAVACLLAGCSYLGDDYVLTQATPEPFAASLYSASKISLDALRRFPELETDAVTPYLSGDTKALVQFYPRYAGRIKTGFPIKALVLPQVTGRAKSALTEISPGAGLRGLAPSTWLQLSLSMLPDTEADALAFQAMAALARSVPNYRLELGTNTSEVVDTVQNLLARL